MWKVYIILKAKKKLPNLETYIDLNGKCTVHEHLEYESQAA